MCCPDAKISVNSENPKSGIRKLEMSPGYAPQWTYLISLDFHINKMEHVIVYSSSGESQISKLPGWCVLLLWPSGCFHQGPKKALCGFEWKWMALRTSFASQSTSGWGMTFAGHPSRLINASGWPSRWGHHIHNAGNCFYILISSGKTHYQLEERPGNVLSFYITLLERKGSLCLYLTHPIFRSYSSTKAPFCLLLACKWRTMKR